MWLVFALLSAVFAALTSILAKIGIDGVDSNLATAIRTVVVVLLAWGMVFLTDAQGGIGAITDSRVYALLSREAGFSSSFPVWRRGFHGSAIIELFS